MNENDILDNIKKYMELRNWSLYRLAKESEIPYTSLHSMFEKNTQPTLSTLRKLCDGLGINLCDFFSDDAKPDSLNCTEDESDLLASYRRLSSSDKKLILSITKRFSK